MTSTWSHFENELSVAGKTLADAPSAFWHELQNDWKNHKVDVLVQNLEWLAVGVVTGVAMKAAPMSALVAATTAFTAYRAIGGITPTIDVVKNAWNADTEEKRSQLGIKYGGVIGAGSAHIVETMPGFMLGSHWGTKLFERSPLVRGLAYSVTGPVEQPMQRFMAFHGKGVETLPPGAVGKGLIDGGTVDALKLSDVVQPTTDREVMRSINLESGKVSKVFNGNKDFVAVPFTDRPGNLFVHTHLPDTGPRPGLIDLTAAQDLGIVKSGNYRSFFIGQKGVQAGAERLQALILDDANKEAFLLNNARYKAATTAEAAAEATAGKGSQIIWQDAYPTYVDYNQARTTLQSLDVKNAWAQFTKLPTLDLILAPEHLNIANGLKLSTPLPTRM